MLVGEMDPADLKALSNTDHDQPDTARHLRYWPIACCKSTTRPVAYTSTPEVLV